MKKNQINVANFKALSLNQYKKIKALFLKGNNKKILLKKYLIVLFMSFAILFSCFMLRANVLNGNIVENSTPFIKITSAEFNTGVAFSFLSTNKTPALVYTLQIVPTVIGLIFILFSSNLVNIFACCFITFGGMANLIDRAIVDNYQGVNYVDAVVDYFAFVSFKFGIFNLADSFITIGLFIVIVLVIISLIVESRNERKKKSMKDDSNKIETPEKVNENDQKT
jgi:signal peptidase II